MSRVSKQELSRVMAHLGSRKSEAKAKAARANAKLPRKKKTPNAASVFHADKL
jgi:hypothetical protein